AYIRSLHFVSRSVDFFFFMLRPPPTSTLFPYTTLFRSDDITPSELKGTRTIVFSTSGRPPTPSMHRIDGKLFDGEVGAAVVLNQVEEWKIVNETYASASGGAKISHPFHIHINPFQISEFFDPSAFLSSTAGAGTVTSVAATSPQPAQRSRASAQLS